MKLEDLQKTVINALEDIKGQDIQVFDATPLTSMFDRVIVVSGTSNRQTRALAKHLHDEVKQAGGGVYGTEGEETGEWVLVDLGDIIVHIMQPTIRDYYRLEEIWGAHPIEWKRSGKKSPAKKPAAKKPAAKKAAAKKPVAKKPAAKKPAAKKPAAKKPGAKKPGVKPARK